MSSIKNTTLVLALTLLAAAAGRAALPTLGWDAETSTSLSKAWPLRQGATARLEARLLNFGAPLALAADTPCSLYWQTNGMAWTQWWELPAEVTTNGVVSADFTADVAAPNKISFFFRVGESNAVVYDALGTLNILPSPGVTVNALPLPASVIDFATITVHNPLWATTNDIDAAVAAILEDDPVAYPISTNALAKAEAARVIGTNAQAIAAAALPKVSTNGWETGSHAGFLTEEADTLDAVISRSPFAEMGFVVGTTELSYVGGGSLGFGSQITPSGYFCLAGGFNASATNDFSFVWQGSATGLTEPVYFDHGLGTFNINPVGGLFGMWIGEQTLGGLLAGKADTATVSNTVHDVATSLVGHPYVLQGSTVVPATNAVLSVSGVATNSGGGVINIMPYLADRPDQNGSTGTLHIATAPDTFIVDIDADIAVSSPTGMDTPMTWYPVEWRSERVSETNWIVYAWAPGQPDTYASLNGYFATLSNLVVKTYNRPGYRPNTLTNDTAALPSYTDTTDLSRADDRRIPTAEGVRDYVTARKREIAASAWRLTPAGRDAPSADFVTIDLPLVQQGQMAFLQSGDYFVMSYEGADWRSATVGSMWAIGASGRSDLTITAEARMAFIRDFAVVGETATIYAATNWMGGAASTNGVPSGADPYVEFTQTLTNPQWLACPDCTRSYHVDAVNGDYWRFIAPATAQTMFYRVQIPGGDRRIIASPRLRLMNGLEVVNGSTNQLDLITVTNGTEVIQLMGKRL